MRIPIAGRMGLPNSVKCEFFSKGLKTWVTSRDFFPFLCHGTMCERAVPMIPEVPSSNVMAKSYPASSLPWPGRDNTGLSS